MTLLRVVFALAICSGLVFSVGCATNGDGPEAGVCACGDTCECPAHSGGECTCGTPDVSAGEGGSTPEVAVLCACGDACQCPAKATPGTACTCGSGS